MTNFWMRTLLVVAVTTGCSSKDNSEVTDRASKELREAQTAVSAKNNEVAATGTDVERRKNELEAEQQKLAEKEKALEDSKRELGSAQGMLSTARTAYAAAVKERLAKLDAALTGLAARTDAASKDASTGLAARRERLATRLTQMPDGADASWIAYTKDVDTTFDAIERDLKAATP